MQESTEKLLDQLVDGVGQGIEAARAVSDSHHAAPIHAFIRQGADEIGQVLAAFPDSVQPTSELGQIFEPTSQEVTQENRQMVDNTIDEIVPDQAPAQEQELEQEMEM